MPSPCSVATRSARSDHERKRDCHTAAAREVAGVAASEAPPRLMRVRSSSLRALLARMARCTQLSAVKNCRASGSEE